MIHKHDDVPPAPESEMFPGSAPATGAQRAAAAAICPYVAGGDGSWRSVQPTRSHVCAAVQPPAPLTAAKQRQLCLTDAHRGCATFTAARALIAPAAAGTFDADLWPSSRPRVVTLEPVRGGLAGLTSPQAKAGGQALLVGLMVVAFLVLVIARTTSPSSSSPSPSGAPASLPAVAASAQPSGGTPSDAHATPPSAAPASNLPSTTPAPSEVAEKTYKVKSGDTLSRIAAKFGVTVRALRKANGLTTTSVIHPGDVLIVPAP